MTAWTGTQDAGAGVISQLLASTAGFEALNVATGLIYGGDDTVFATRSISAAWR